MQGFILNGLFWRVKDVRWDSPELIDRTDNLRLATTDPDSRVICLSNRLSGALKARVLIHEMGHAIMVSYNLIPELHKMVRPERWMETEEWVCNFLADYGMTAYDRACMVLGCDAIHCVPGAMSRLVA